MKRSDNLICPYCGAGAKLVDSIVVYKSRSYGMMYVCSNYPECDAYVGCHPNSTKPLGRLADYNLRAWKSNAHVFFDSIWKNKYMSRPKAYKWLSSQLEIPQVDCHIGMFDIEMCKRVVSVCKTYLKERGYM